METDDAALQCSRSCGILISNALLTDLHVCRCASVVSMCPGVQELERPDRGASALEQSGLLLLKLQVESTPAPHPITLTIPFFAG